MSELFHNIKLKKIVRETPDAASYVFDIPAHLKEKFQYLPGQYITLRTYINGAEVRRAYSFSSSPITDADPAVTIKKVHDGVFSGFMNDKAYEGMEIQAMAPLGKFTVLLNPANKNHYILYGGGSGITPIMSIIKSVMDKEPQSRLTLIYCNQDEPSIIFYPTLKNMEAASNGQLKVIHCLDNPPAGWQGRSGRQSADDYKALAQQLILPGYNNEHYTCGPSGMMDQVKQGLLAAGVPSDKIHYEYFTAPVHNKPTETTVATASSLYDDEEQEETGLQKATVILNGRETEIEIQKGETILEAAKREDLDPPYACQIGVCTTCRAKLLEGNVEMDEREGLSDAEIKEGYILTCQSHPTTKKVKLVYE